MKPTKKLFAGALSAALILAALTGCASSGSSGGAPGDIDAALAKGGYLTYWAWTPASAAKVKQFEKAYPKVHVKLVNAGSGGDEYPKVTNALKAGKGAPDVVQIENTAVPQFALADHLVDLSPYGFDKYEKDFSEGTWSAVQYEDKVVGLPEDAGPMALFYNKRVYDAHGIAVPKTWADFVAAAKKLHQADPNTYLTSDNGDGLFVSSMIWQAGGHPYTVDGTKVKIDLQDAGSKKWTGVWNQLVEDKLLASTVPYTDDWYKQLGNGEIASLVSGAWMVGLLQTAAPDAAGDWRVAPMPTYDGGKPVSANYGGSSEVVLDQTKNPALAAGFLRFINTDDRSIAEQVSAGSFPAKLSAEEAPDFQATKNDYFGGQATNEVFYAASKAVPAGWQYLPYQTYAQTIVGDTVGQAYVDNTSLDPALRAWQKSLVKYGDAQGFTVTGK